MTTLRCEDLEVLEHLGGSRAAVHRAVVRTSGRVVAVKHAPWDQTDAVAGLAREAGVLERVHHPSLVRLLGTIEDDRGRMLLLAHAPGGSLADRVATHGPWAAAEVAELGSHLAGALAALHRAGVVHRDVHPGNVLVDAELRPVLADLDHALDQHADALPTDRQAVGHPDHVAPHAIAGEPPSPRDDLHGLATTLWTATTGAPPPRSGPQAAVVLPPAAAVPGPLRTVIAACLDGSIGDAAAAAAALRATALDPDVRTAGTALTDPRPGDRGGPPPGGDVPPTAGPQRAAARASAIAGGGAGSSDASTRRWGPRPGRAHSTIAVGARRSSWVLGGLAALVLPALVLGWWLAPHDGPAAAVDDGPAAVAEEVRPPPPCADDDGDRPGVAADLDGSGCSQLLRLEDGVLHTPVGRYELGRPGDVLVAGDWDGDGRWTPGLYRPGTGEVFLFDGLPDGGALHSRPALQRAPGGVPVVVTEDGGGHTVTVRGDDA